MRILVCNWKDGTHPAAGGAEVYVETVARQWAAWGEDVTIFCARTPSQTPEEEVAGVRVVRRGGRFLVYRQARRFFRSPGGGRFDVVLDVVNTRPFLAPRWAGDVPVVALIFQVAREVWDFEMPPGVAAVGRRWLEPRWLRHYATVPTLTISASSRESLAWYGLRDVTVVPVGLEPPVPAARPPKEGRPTVVFLGRLAANKRPDHAVEAFLRAQDHIPDAQMWVVGSGPEESALRRRAEGRPVRFFGRVDQATKLDLLARAHALLVTSVREGWGLVVTEAAAVGTPAIGYDVAGLRDSLRASNGVLVPPTVDDLAGALTRLLPVWSTGAAPAARPAGVHPWPDVARAVLDHLVARRGCDRG